MSRPDQTLEYDIAIAGGGMVGCTIAALLVKQGFKVAIFDQSCVGNWQGGHPNLRVSAINLASKKIFEWLECWKSIESLNAFPYRAMHVWEENSTASISFDSQELAHSELGYIIENDAIRYALIDKLQQNFNFSLFQNTAITDYKPSASGVDFATSKGGHFHCNLLVGADGVNSKVRELMGISSTMHDYQQQAIVCRVDTEHPHQATAWQCFLTTGPVALLPLSNGQCSIVWSCDSIFATHLMTLNDNEFCAQLGRHIATKVGNIVHCSARTAFPIMQHHSQTYIAQHTVLIGDAAHTTHPLAGLGANTGLMDAAALAEVISQSRDNGKPYASRPTLRKYERWRKGENALILASMKSFKNTFGTDNPTAKQLRILGLNVADRSHQLKKIFSDIATGTIGDLPKVCQ